MNVLALVILLITCTSSDGLMCATTKGGLYLTESLNGLTSKILLKRIKGLKTKDYGYDMCRMQFNVSYDEGILTVLFTEHLQTQTLPDKFVQVETYMQGANISHIGTNHVIQYACSKDLCETKFVKKYRAFLHWLLDADYSELSYQIGLSIFGDGEEKDVGECFNQNNVIEACSSGHCEATDVTSKKTPYQSTQLCVVDKDAMKQGAEFYVIRIFDPSFEIINATVKLRCKYDKCNAQNKFKEVESEFFKVHDIATIFGIGENETTTHSTKSTVSSTSVTNPATKISLANTAMITSVTKSQTDNIMTTTEANNGFHVQSTNTIIYLTLIIFISYWFLLA